MDSKVHRFLAVFLLTEAYLCCVDANYKEYVSLISDVHNEYKTSSVFLIFPERKFRMEDHTTAHSLSRIFSKQSIFTLITNFDDLYDHLDYHQKRITRPLVVVMLKSIDDINRFDRSTQRVNKSLSIWLMIFHGNSGNSVCKYCRQPLGNRFRLRFDTTMLVLCCGEPTLQEWWSIDGNSTKIGNIGNWTANEKLTLLAAEVRTAQRYDIHELKLRLAFSSSTKNYTSNLLKQLQDVMKFEFTMVPLPVFNSTGKGEPSELVLLSQEKADLALGIFIMTESRLKVVDFTNPFVLIRSKLYFRQPDAMGVHLTAYFKVFESRLWLIIIALVMAIAVLLTIIKAQHISESWISLCVENYLCVWGIFCQQGLFYFPDEGSMRIAFVSTYITAIVVYVAYSAKFISFLAAASSALPFVDLDGFVRDGSYKLILSPHSPDYDILQSSNVSIFKRMKSLLKPHKDLPVDKNEAWKQVCSERVGYLSDEMSRAMYKVGCRTVGINTGKVIAAGMAVPAGSQYTDALNYHIERFRSSGLLHRLNTKHFDPNNLASSASDVVELSRVVPIFLILIGGIILALIVLFCETLYCIFDSRRNCRSEDRESRKSEQPNYVDHQRIEGLWKKYARPFPSLPIEQFGATSIGYYP